MVTIPASSAASTVQTSDPEVELAPATPDRPQAQLDVLDDLRAGRVVADERGGPVVVRLLIILGAVGDVARGPLGLPDGVVAHHEVLEGVPRGGVSRELDPAAAHVGGVAPRDDVVLPSDVVHRRQGAEVGEEAVDEPVLDLRSLALTLLVPK